MEVNELIKDFTFEVATADEVLAILSEKRLIGLVSKKKTLTDLAATLHLKPRLYYIVKYKQYRTLFETKQLAHNTCEVHIACPKDSLIASRILVLALCAWLLKVSELAPSALITSCPEGKIANMLRKIGTKEVKRVGDKIYFMATAETFNLT